jgi:hypothetical protein
MSDQFNPMEEDPVVTRLKVKYAAMPPLFPQSDYLTIEENKPVTFFVLCDEYSSKGVWVHPVGVHFVNKKQIVCSEVAKAGPCFICEQIREMEKQRVPEPQIFRVRAPEKYAMNVLIKGETRSRVFLAPRTVAEEIVGAFESNIAKNINIFDPLAATPWTVTRLKQSDGQTQYTVEAAFESLRIVTGDNAEERIAKILRCGANLDDRFRLVSRSEQESAWRQP